jgi:MoxR-like ATPase/predicted RNA-binding protein
LSNSRDIEEKYWIYSVDPENWEVVKKHNVWASRVPIEKINERIHQNDYVIFFVTGTKKFQGIFKFSSDWYNAKNVIWPDETDEVRYFSQIKLKPIANRNVDLWDVAKKLEYFPEPENKRDSSLKLQGRGGYPSNKESLSKKDFKILLSEMKHRYFVAMGPWSNWEHSLSRKPILWGVKPDTSGTNIGEFNRLLIGDIIFFYVTLEKPSKFSKYGFFGVGKVVRKCPNEEELYWPNETNEEKYTHRFQIKPIKIFENDDDILWFDGLPNTKGLAGIKSNNPGLEPLLDAVEKKWNVDIDEIDDKFYLYQNNPSYPVLRKDKIDKYFGINYAGGITDYKNKNDYIVLISSLAGIYRDKIGEQLITYTGQGQTGDQTLTGGNLGIVEAKEKSRKLYFLEELEGPNGKRTNDYRFLGEVEYLAHYFEDEPTENRKVIRFILKRTNGPWDLKHIHNLSEKQINHVAWNPNVDFNTSTKTIKLPKNICEQFNISKKDTIQIKLDTITITSSFIDDYEILIPEDVRTFLKTRQDYTCVLEKINPIILQNINESDFSHYNQLDFELNSKIISFQKIGTDYYFDCYGHVMNFRQDKCSDLSRNLMLPITNKISSFCSEPILRIEEIELKNKLQKIITNASYGISGQKPLVLIVIIYWLSKNKFKEKSLVEYLKKLKKPTSDDILELLIHNSKLFSDYVLIYKLYEALELIRFEFNRAGMGYFIKQALEMNTNDGRLITEISINGLDESLSEIEPDRAKILLYNLLKENLDESILMDFWNRLYGEYYAIKCPPEILDKIKNQPNFDPESPVIEIKREIYTSLMSQFSEISQTNEVSDGKLRIPTKEEIEAGIKEIKKELLIDGSIIEEIVMHLASGRHVLLAGPVGTGKTRLSQLIPGIFWTENCGYFGDVRTATADWTTQDVIGGISPKISDNPINPITYEIDNGCVTDTVLENYEKESRKTENTIRHTSVHTVNDEKKQFHGTWLVIDEFNRADIDKAFGQLFTALEYGVLKIQDIHTEKTIRSIKIPKDYRIIGTLNTADKHYLFNLSDALKRRFAYVEISIPEKDKKLEMFLAAKNALKELDQEKLQDIIKIEKDSEDFDFISESLKEKLGNGYNALEIVRSFKPLGTAILKLIYQNLITAEKIGLDNSFDHAINANIIPQLETIPKPTIKILYEYLFGDVVNFLKTETQKEQYQVGLEAILSYMEYADEDIESHLKGILTGDVPDMKAEITSMKESHKIEFAKSSIFKKSLDKILKQSEF